MARLRVETYVSFLPGSQAGCKTTRTAQDHPRVQRLPHLRLERAGGGGARAELPVAADGGTLSPFFSALSFTSRSKGEINLNIINLTNVDVLRCCAGAFVVAQHSVCIARA